MAAVNCAKSAGAELGKMARQKGRVRPVDAGAGAGTEARALTQDEARCPMCSDIFLKPVTMPCSHSVCLPCFKQKVEFSTLRCPICRLRVSSWARRRSREKTLVNTELWDMVRRSYPERCERRMEQDEGEAGGEVIFRAPVHICKSAEIQHEYEKTKVEKQKEGKISELHVHKIFKGDSKHVEGERQKKRQEALGPVAMSDDNRNVPSHQREEDCGIPKHCRESWRGVISDSENEEPIGRRTRHISAFVSKTRGSPASRILRNRAVQRSKSCTDSEEDRRKSHSLSQLSSTPKALFSYSHNAGILLSSENSRSLSAPILVPDKKHTWRGIPAAATTFLASQIKTERSISPESNDSISEELNHFKPIVCSPCTPPKRLPDGRVVEPTIVKSTPRNLTRSFQKPTSYEASPTILQKWRQIEIDRQDSKVTSKGTITSPLTEDFALNKSPVEKSKIVRTSLDKTIIKDHHTLSTERGNASEYKKAKTLSNKRKLVFDQPTGEPGLSITHSAKVSTPAVILPTRGTSDAVQEVQLETLKYDTPTSTLPSDKDTQGTACNRNPTDTRDQNEALKLSQPTSKRGRKRSQKTKHLEETRTAKKLKPVGEDSFVAEIDGEYLRRHRLQQEREDHKLAVKLQRQLNREFDKVDRRKISPEKYLIRSWVSVSSQPEYSPRRSGRISKKNEHFNYS